VQIRRDGNCVVSCRVIASKIATVEGAYTDLLVEKGGIGRADSYWVANEPFYGSCPRRRHTGESSSPKDAYASEANYSEVSDATEIAAGSSIEVILETCANPPGYSKAHPLA
jgi:hypothetical protein